MAKATKPAQTPTAKQEPTKMATFSDILSTPMSNVEKPKPRPTGTYVGMVTTQPEITKIGKNQTDAAIFKVKLLSPGPDVDTDALREVGGMGTRELRITQFLTADSLYRVKEFLAALGVDVEAMTLGEALGQATNRQGLFKIKHRPSADGTELYEEFESVASI